MVPPAPPPGLTRPTTPVTARTVASVTTAGTRARITLSLPVTASPATADTSVKKVRIYGHILMANTVNVLIWKVTNGMDVNMNLNISVV